VLSAWAEWQAAHASHTLTPYAHATTAAYSPGSLSSVCLTDYIFLLHRHGENLAHAIVAQALLGVDAYPRHLLQSWELQIDAARSAADADDDGPVPSDGALSTNGASCEQLCARVMQAARRNLLRMLLHVHLAFMQQTACTETTAVVTEAGDHGLSSSQLQDQLVLLAMCRGDEPLCPEAASTGGCSMLALGAVLARAYIRPDSRPILTCPRLSAALQHLVSTEVPDLLQRLQHAPDVLLHLSQGKPCCRSVQAWLQLFLGQLQVSVPGRALW
jgi:hypothetical protein